MSSILSNDIPKTDIPFEFQALKLEHLVEPARRVPDLEDRLEGSLAESLAQEKALRCVHGVLIRL